MAISSIEALSEVEVDSDSEMKAALKGVAAAALVLPAQMSGLVETYVDFCDLVCPLIRSVMVVHRLQKFKTCRLFRREFVL